MKKDYIFSERLGREAEDLGDTLNECREVEWLTEGEAKRFVESHGSSFEEMRNDEEVAITSNVVNGVEIWNATAVAYWLGY